MPSGPLSCSDELVAANSDKYYHKSSMVVLGLALLFLVSVQVLVDQVTSSHRRIAGALTTGEQRSLPGCTACWCSHVQGRVIPYNVQYHLKKTD